MNQQTVSYQRSRKKASMVLSFLYGYSILGFTLCAQASREAGREANTSVRQANQLEFEIATIKPASPSNSEAVETIIYPQGRIVLHKQSLKSIICLAFNIGFWQVVGNQELLNTYYDIDARAPEDFTAPTYITRHVNGFVEDERLRQMLQGLLVKRFQLRYSLESKTSNVYSLERNDKLLRIESAAGEKQSQFPMGISAHSGAGWTFHDVSMQEIARYLSAFYRKTVLNNTGVEGNFSFTSTKILTAEDFHGTDIRETLPPVIFEMGLKIVPTTGTSESFAVKHIAGPSEN